MMPGYNEDLWIDEHAETAHLDILRDCSVAVDASYYLSIFLEKWPYHEALLPALGGLTGIERHIEQDLDQWAMNEMVPFFIFDGQYLRGQEEIAMDHSMSVNLETNKAWTLYFEGKANEAVDAFRAITAVFSPRTLYPMLMRILKARGLHFMVPPFNASAQIGYFQQIESEQVAAIMGSQELLLYPKCDRIIKSIKWDRKQFVSIWRPFILKMLNISELMLVDALLMSGTSFMPPFPPLRDTTMYERQPAGVMDAMNILRTSDKLIANACASFHDVLQKTDPHWLDKYQRARMAVDHFIYIAENGEIKVNNDDTLTSDHYEYLSFQLPAELFHYLNTGLIGSRLLNSITHNQLIIQPTLDGAASKEYKKLVTDRIMPVREMTLGLMIPRLHRGLQHKDIKMRVWFDKDFSRIINSRLVQPPPSTKVATWDVKESDIRPHFPPDFAGPVSFEVLSLANPDFVKSTFADGKQIRGLDTAETITSVTIWRFLHLRDYVNDNHTLTRWGNALAMSLMTIKDIIKGDVPGIDEAILLAFELIRLDVLNGKNSQDELYGLPLNGTDEDKTSLLLISRCSTLLKLRHQKDGYTGPLNKNLLAFRSLSSLVREADRDLIEAIVASMFMFAQAKRDRDDQVEIAQRLPFLESPDIAMGIAVKTYLDDAVPDESAEAKARRIDEFPPKYLPYATHFGEDLDNSFKFFDALSRGVQTLDMELSEAEKAVWARASEYLESRQ